MARPGSIAAITPRAHWRGYDTLAIALAGLATAAAFAVAHRYEEENHLERLRVAAKERLQDARSEFRDELAVLEATRALWSASETVERSEFGAFAAPLLASYRELVSIEWVPAVPRGEVFPGGDAPDGDGEERA